MSNGFTLDKELGYFQNKGVDVMAFDDIYPEGHQAGVSIIMHGRRVSTNGDLRFDKLPGQWQGVPKQCARSLDIEANTIKTELAFPDDSRISGFNPMDYPDISLQYSVNVKGKGNCIVISVDLTAPIPDSFEGMVCFIMELYPADLFGQPWIMDDKQGIFPTQPNGPDVPYAVGNRLIVRPDNPYTRLTIVSETAALELYDERMSHANGWFVVSSDIPTGVTKDALRWVITPNVVDDWLHTPVVQVSQVGYHPAQPKVAVIELDKRLTREDREAEKAVLCKVTENGKEKLCEISLEPAVSCSASGTSQNTGSRASPGAVSDAPVLREWGRFLRYNYLKFDFSIVKEEGLYRVCYGSSESSIFRIASDIYDRGVWQPVLEYFLPIQMCHMKVNEKARVWHGLCHTDDAQMAPTDHIHFDGYRQGTSTLTKYKPGESVPGLNVGGWHDAGDDDLRVESQAGECYILSLAFEEFGVDYDATTIDQESKTVEIHQPDGKNDILQQIEHGALSVVGAYRALGRLYRGIIVNSMDQYVMLGDPSCQTDNISGNEDDRWVFTEEYPARELQTAAELACTARALKGFNDTLSAQALEAAAELFDITDDNAELNENAPPWASAKDAPLAKIRAATELYLTTGEQKYKDYLTSKIEIITENMWAVAWCVARAEQKMGDCVFSSAFKAALPMLKKHYDEQKSETPYGIPYHPHIWGAGWQIQRQGFEYYFLHKAYPDIFEPDMVFDSLNFVLGCHPGSNNKSFASGVGADSALVAYGWNRADWSFCPGGVISGTALIRPDFPELLDFPFLWQQTEYVLGGGSSHYMFLVLAAKKLLD